ncbi:MAG: hypothetical protein IJU84_05695, partial [Clostridia bacterium]|nr:hypothetical protein [Clostridia bacterium]
IQNDSSLGNAELHTEGTSLAAGELHSINEQPDLSARCRLVEMTVLGKKKRIPVKTQRFFIPLRYIQNDSSLGNAELHTEGTSLAAGELHSINEQPDLSARCRLVEMTE